MNLRLKSMVYPSRDGIQQPADLAYMGVQVVWDFSSPPCFIRHFPSERARVYRRAVFRYNTGVSVVPRPFSELAGLSRPMKDARLSVKEAFRVLP